MSALPRIEAGLKTRLYWRMLTCAVLLVCSLHGVAAREQTELAPARNGLRPVPIPGLDDLEPAVSEQIRDARKSFETLVESRGVSSGRLADAYGSLGRVFHAYEFFDSAEASYLNATRLAPADVTWLHLLGYLYQQTGRLDDAAVRFEQAVRAQPNDRAATIRLGQVYLGLNRLREAREQFDSVVAVFPVLARQGLGEVALRERRFDEAIAHFRAVLERVPRASSIHYSLAMAYRGLGRLDEARSHLEQRGTGGITVGDPIVDTLQTLVRGERGLVAQGRRAYDDGQYEQAAAAFAGAIQAAPGSAAARLNLGLAQLQMGKTSDAVASLRAAFELAPDDADVTREFVRVLLRLRYVDEAIQVLTKSRSGNPDDEDSLVGLSILLAERARYGDALALLAESNRQFPERTATATTLARLLASSPDRSLRDGTRALDLATRVYEASPSPVHGETLALALAELGRCDDALTWMKRAVTEAERIDDAPEASRLRRELPKYESASCRP
jgi:tetratricopeptide (TPR) repeat protein